MLPDNPHWRDHQVSIRNAADILGKLINFYYRDVETKFNSTVLGMCMALREQLAHVIPCTIDAAGKSKPVRRSALIITNMDYTNGTLVIPHWRSGLPGKDAEMVLSKRSQIEQWLADLYQDPDSFAAILCSYALMNGIHIDTPNEAPIHAYAQHHGQLMGHTIGPMKWFIFFPHLQEGQSLLPTLENQWERGWRGAVSVG